MADLGPGKAKSRPGKVDLKEVYLRTGKAILRLDHEPRRVGMYDRKQ